jgi:hypothetical protein
MVLAIRPTVCGQAIIRLWPSWSGAGYNLLQRNSLSQI